jgi:hypothetical protein
MYSRNAVKVFSMQFLVSFHKLCDELIAKEKNYSTGAWAVCSREAKGPCSYVVHVAGEKQKYVLRTIS